MVHLVPVPGLGGLFRPQGWVIAQQGKGFRGPWAIGALNPKSQTVRGKYRGLDN